MLLIDEIQSPLGRIAIATRDGRLCALEFGRARLARQPPQRLLKRRRAGLAQLRTWNHLDRGRHTRRRERRAREPARRDLERGHADERWARPWLGPVLGER